MKLHLTRRSGETDNAIIEDGNFAHTIFFNHTPTASSFPFPYTYRFEFPENPTLNSPTFEFSNPTISNFMSYQKVRNPNDADLRLAMMNATFRDRDVMLKNPNTVLIYDSNKEDKRLWIKAEIVT
jgi:hypothetical protein